MTLESRLECLREDVAFPATPDFAANLSLDARNAGKVHPWRRRLLLAAAMLLLVVVVALSVPQSRTTIANWLHAGGIRIELVDRFATNDDAVVDIDSPLILGSEISLDEARDQPGMPLWELAGVEPDRAFIRRQGYASVVSLVYAPGDDLPEIGDSGIGALLMQVPAGSEFMKYTKQGLIEDGFEMADIPGSFGVWFASGMLEVTPYDPGGVFGLDRVVRRTGNVLIWESDGIGYRLETALPKERAIALVEDLVPMEGEAGNRSGGSPVWEATMFSGFWRAEDRT